MDLKSRMSLDVSNVTKNLKKVASDTAVLAKNMSTSFNNTKGAIAGVVSTLKTDMKINGVANTLRGQAASLAKSLSTPFSTMRNSANSAFKSVKASYGSLKNYMGTINPLQSMATTTIKPLVGAIDKANGALSKWLSRVEKTAYRGDKAVKELQESVKKTGIQFKDVSRIVQGIMISKLFYSSLNAIRSATSEVWGFAQALEYSRLVYINFFGSTKMATDFTDILQEFAAKTRFSFQELNASAQQLLAYGFKAKNLMYVLKGVSAAASISGDVAKIESISRALGQINTKGRLMSEEMRQLAEAGIPAYTILQEKLGLTYKQLQHLGDEAIPASLAINALIEGINERFGGLLNSSNLTLSGMLSNIKDVWLQLATGVFEPYLQKAKGVVKNTLGLLNELLVVFKQGGSGAVFERIIPENLQDSIRSLIGAFLGLVASVKQWYAALTPIVSSLLPILITWINMLIGIGTAFNTVISGITTAITNNAIAMSILNKVLVIAAAAWLAYRVQVMAAAASKVMISVVKGISKSLMGLSQTLTKLAQHPFILIAVLLTGILLAATGSFDKLRVAADKFFGSLNGVDSSKILQPKEMKKSGKAVDNYGEAIDSTADAVNDLTDAAKKSTKALLSFDEVFNNNVDEDTDEGITNQWQDFLAELSTGAFDPASLLENIKFEGFANPFVDSLIEEFKNSFKDFGTKLKEALKTINPGNLALAGIVTALALTMGGPVAGLFAGVGSIIVAAFWDDIITAFGLENEKTKVLGITMATAVGAVIGGVMGGPYGAVIGAAIALLASELESKLWSTLREKFELDPESGNSEVGSGIGAGIGAIIGGLLGGPGGAIVGAAVGSLVGGICGLFVDYLFEEFNLMEHGISVAKSIGTLFRSIKTGDSDEIGLALAGLAGDVAAELLKLLAEQLGFASVDELRGKIKVLLTTAVPSPSDFGQIAGAIVRGLVGAIGDKIGMQDPIELADKLSSYIDRTFDAFMSHLDFVLWRVGFRVGNGLDDVGTAIDTWATVTSTALGTKLEPFVTAVEDVMEDIKDAVDVVLSDIGVLTGKSVDGFSSTVLTKLGMLVIDVATKMGEIYGSVSNTFESIGVTVGEKLDPLIPKVSKVFGSMKTKMDEQGGLMADASTLIFGGIYTTITDKITDAKDNFLKNFKDMYEGADIKLDELSISVTKWTSTIYETFKTWLGNMWDNVFNSLFGWIDTAVAKLKDFLGLQEDANTSKSAIAPGTPTPGSTGITSFQHAKGGIFNREHIARFAEGNKAEAIIPLQNDSAMQPFVDAIVNGLSQGFLPVLASASSNSSSLQPIWVGTLIADERGLKELNNKFKIINAAESTRRGDING